MVTEKHLALLASTISLVLATMSATALIMVNSARTEMKTQHEESQREIGKLNSLVSQLKDNQIAMLPLIGRPSEISTPQSRHPKMRSSLLHQVKPIRAMTSQMRRQP